MQTRALGISAVFSFIAFLLASPANVAAEDYYAGKTIRFVVGFAAGGGYDTYTRAIARHIGRHIPGNPSTVVENMDGAGSLIAAHHVYRNADPDGLTVGVFNSALVLRQALGDKSVRFDARKFGWVGTPSVGIPSCAVMGFTGMKTLDDVLDSKKPIKMGSTRRGATTDDLPRILNLVLKSKFDIISGYKGTGPIRIALQKGEVDGVCFGWESMRTTGRAMLDASGNDKLIPFIVHGRAEDKEVAHLPRLKDAVKEKAGEKGLAVLDPWLQQYEMQRPLSVPPGTPKDRLAMLRKAFKATLEDPTFLKEAKNSKLLITHVSGEEAEKLVGQILATPAEAKENLQFLLAPAKKK